jgi:hypothetical protein
MEEVWAAKHYRVKESMQRDICSRLQVQPQVDVFGIRGRSSLKRCWGPTGQDGSAWSRDWSREKGLLWANPAVNDVSDCLRMLKRYGNQAVVVVPNWDKEDWFQEMWPMCKKYQWYGPEAEIYGSAQQPSWGSWACLLDGRSSVIGGGDLQSMEGDGKMMMAELKVQRHDTSRRRYRRKVLKQHYKQ